MVQRVKIKSKSEVDLVFMVVPPERKIFFLKSTLKFKFKLQVFPLFKKICWNNPTTKLYLLLQFTVSHHLVFYVQIECKSGMKSLSMKIWRENPVTKNCLGKRTHVKWKKYGFTYIETIFLLITFSFLK